MASAIPDRHVATQATANNFGGFELTSLLPGQTLTRCLWMWHSTGAGSTVSGFPPGSAIVKVGLIVDVPGIPEASMPTPISQEVESWIDIVTLGWHGNIATSTNVDWLWFATIGPPEKEAKAQRKNTTGGLLSLYLTWESLFASDTDPAFTFTGTASCDAFVLN